MIYKYFLVYLERLRRLCGVPGRIFIINLKIRKTFLLYPRMKYYIYRSEIECYNSIFECDERCHNSIKLRVFTLNVLLLVRDDTI